jgi:hypothetical protein
MMLVVGIALVRCGSCRGDETGLDLNFWGV